MPQKTATKHRWSVFCSLGPLLLGCPLYEEQCDGPSGCATGYYCDQFNLRCQPATRAPACARPDQCGFAETCTPDRVCRPGSCDFHGCTAGYRCGVVDSAHTCVPDAGNSTAPDAATPQPADAAAGSPPLEGAPDASSLDASAADL
jgi:hypothetical protein